ncbi:MAG: hypothetical protein K2I70_02745 [Bacilli bacterium]|nr:hypothetical protein [Bacilli bacterium]
MKKRNIIICLLLVLCILPLPVFAAKKKTTTTTTTTADVSKMVKVYLFEKDGCSYCELQKEYLQGLESYNKKFTLIVKQLYDANWDPAEDYELGAKVAEAFASAKFDTDVSGTPLVIISDIYGANVYSDNLEETINKAYEEGDKDAVSCLEKGGKNSECVRGAKDEADHDMAGLLIFLIAIGIVVAIVVTSRVNKNTEYYQE